MLILARQPRDLAADSEYIQSMMSEVQKLPVEIAEGKQRVYGAFLKNDFGLAGNERAIFEWGARQTYLPLGNMMTAAALIGIDSCPIEGFDKQKMEQLLADEGIMDPEHFGLACMVAFGYRSDEPRVKTRQNASQVVEWV